MRWQPFPLVLGFAQQRVVTYLLTPWSRAPLEKLPGSAASQEIPRIFGTRKFLTVPTSARHLSLSWANSVQSPPPPPTSRRSILILSSHLRLGLPSGQGMLVILIFKRNITFGNWWQSNAKTRSCSVDYNNSKGTQRSLKFSKLMIMTMQCKQISETLQQGWVHPV